MTYFCPYCFAEIPQEQTLCPFCGTNITLWLARTSYRTRLIHSLKHPLSEVRMGAIISLGNIASPAAAMPLAKCALRYPKDMVQNIQILVAIKKISSSPQRERAFELLKNHPSSFIQREIMQLLPPALHVR